MQFRYSPEDELSIGKSIILKKLVSNYIIGVFHRYRLIGMGGLGFLPGSKLSHRSLIWGIYINGGFRSKGTSKIILDSLISQAESLGSESLLLTVVSNYNIAINLYENMGLGSMRWVKKLKIIR